MLPGWTRDGTMKSRAPSGVDLISSGVSTSTKPFAWWTSESASQQLRAQDQPLVDLLAPQVEVAVLEPQRLVGVGGVVDRKWRRLGGGQHLDVSRADLDVAGRQLGVLGAGQALRDLALDSQDELVAHAAGDLVRLR